MPIEETLCPECGKKMISRKNKWDERFWGCPDYPKCTGTRDVNGLSKYEKDRTLERPDVGSNSDRKFTFRKSNS